MVCMNIYLILFSFILFFSPSISIFSQEYALYYPVNDSLQIGLFGAPYASYSSESGINLGLSILLFEKNLSQNIVAGQYFRMRVDAEYSLEDERGFSIDGKFPIRSFDTENKNKNQMLSFDISYKSAPKTFYGVGGNTNTKDLTNYRKEHYRFEGNWLIALLHNIHVGVAWDISGYKNKEIDEAKKGYKFGFDHFYRAFGMGTVLVLNTKTPNNFPQKGIFYKNELMIYDKALISDFDFITLKQEFHYFLPISHHVVANQIVSHNTFKNRPFHYLTEQGGANLMRGFHTGRYLDNQFLGAQTEYRSPIFFWRVSGVCFLASGISYKGKQDFSSENLHFTGGVGLRFAIDKKERVNIRADIGFSNEGRQIYLKFNEAF